ncbi:MAG: hypothetical protein PHN38_04720 [Sulfurospirillaceae bacterium]|nr:hypothetical protein [Sulfurospirillaceae bacterium]
MYPYTFVILALFLTGCGPKYILKNEYSISTSPQAKECVNGCSFLKQTCEKNYQTCLNSAYERAKQVESEEIAVYHKEYDRYLFDFEGYRQERHRWEFDFDVIKRDAHYFDIRCVSSKDSYACHRANELERALRRMERNRPFPPPMPLKPSFGSILSQQQETCLAQFDCMREYDSCFVGCGGEVRTYKVCVENCK